MSIASPLAASTIGRLVLRIYKYMSSVPASVKEDNYWFYSISNLAYTLIIVLHASWILVFYFFDQTTMMSVQLISIAAYIAAMAVNRRGYHFAGMLIGLLEANLHQTLAVASFGWIAGFQNLIPLMALMPFLKYNEKWITKIVLGLLCLAFYLYIDIFIKDQPPLQHLTGAAMNFFNFSNGVLCFILAALWGIVLAISYQRTVNALIRKEQELFTFQKAQEQADILRQLEVTERDNEIFHLRNVELKNSNDEINQQKELIEAMVSEQEIIILRRTSELAESNEKLTELNKKLVELIQYNAHSLREPLTRIMGAIDVASFITPEVFQEEIWPHLGKAVNDLDTRIRDVISLANDTIKLYGK